MRIRDTPERKRRLRKVMDATGDNTKSGAIDVALAHYLRDLRNEREIADELATGHVDAFSTGQLPLDPSEDTHLQKC